jgi:intracellular septation protein A
VDEEIGRLRGGMSKGFVRDIVVSGVLPWIAVFVLQHYGVALVPALAIATVFPVADGIFSLVRYRRLDAIGIVNLSFLLGSIAITFWSGDVHVSLLKGAVLTAAFSLVCLGSLLAPKPLMFFLGRQLSTRGDAALVAEWNERWQYARFRRTMRLITAAWGVGYLLEVVARVAVAYSFPPLVAMGLAPVITYGVLAILIAWTIAYSSAMRRKYAAYPAA